VRRTLGGSRLGVVDLPVCDGRVPGRVLADAVADHHSWTLLERYLRDGVYRTAVALRDEDGGTRSAWRGELCVASGLPGDGEACAAALHARAGWLTLLQEAWGAPADATDDFYHGGTPAAAGPDVAHGEPHVLEISAPLGDLAVAPGAAFVDVELRIGGAPVALFTVEPADGAVRASHLRAAATRVAGYELCRVVVREAILGQPLGGPATLRDRLARRAAASPEARDRPPATLPSPASPAASWHRVVAAAEPDAAALLARRPGDVGTSASRRAALPAAARGALADAADAAGEPVVHRADGRRAGRARPVPARSCSGAARRTRSLPKAAARRPSGRGRSTCRATTATTSRRATRRRSTRGTRPVPTPGARTRRRSTFSSAPAGGSRACWRWGAARDGSPSSSHRTRASCSPWTCRRSRW
jgi:hypothetical protein